MDIFAVETTPLKLQYAENLGFASPALSMMEEEQESGQRNIEEAESESRFFVMEDLFKFPTESITAVESPLRFSDNFSPLFEEEQGLVKRISKPKSACKVKSGGKGREGARSPEARRKLHFASKIAKAKEFSLEGHRCKPDSGLLKSKASSSEAKKRHDSLETVLTTGASTKINSRKSSNDRISKFVSPLLPFNPPEITNFPLEKLKKIANSFNFNKKREKKVENPLKLEISSFNQPANNVKFANLVSSILKFSRDINAKAGSSCSSLQSDIERMYQKAEDKKASYEKKVQEVKMRKFKSLLNF